MLNSIVDRRVKKDRGYDLELVMSAREYFNFYEDVTEEEAEHIVNLFLEHSQDDGRPNGVKVNYDPSNDSIKIRATLEYEGNDFTEHPDSFR